MATQKQIDSFFSTSENHTLKKQKHAEKLSLLVISISVSSIIVGLLAWHMFIFSSEDWNFLYLKSSIETVYHFRMFNVGFIILTCIFLISGIITFSKSSFLLKKKEKNIVRIFGGFLILMTVLTLGFLIWYDMLVIDLIENFLENYSEYNNNDNNSSCTRIFSCNDYSNEAVEFWKTLQT